MTQIWALRSRLEKQPTDLRRDSRDLGDGTLGLGIHTRLTVCGRIFRHFRWECTGGYQPGLVSVRALCAGDIADLVNHQRVSPPQEMLT
jgi:hypothetical protein